MAVVSSHYTDIDLEAINDGYVMVEDDEKAEEEVMKLVEAAEAPSMTLAKLFEEEKAEWDRLSKEAWLQADMAMQLAAAQEREAETCRDSEEIHGMFVDLSATVKLEEEEATRILKEWDELLEKDAQASKRAVEVLKELETERDLRRKAESRAMALQQKADEDVKVVRSLWADLGDAVSRRLSTENVSVKLEKELAHVRRTL
ncbi:uncharacterized protein [Miscanthus floridulus]|uniref:uncharacterized protein n=1 Tax=Miscanthus floridulus TaxID=154761 RepID=UPI00345912CA